LEVSERVCGEVWVANDDCGPSELRGRYLRSLVSPRALESLQDVEIGGGGDAGGSGLELADLDGMAYLPPPR
jgi:hypothetical protein